MKRVTLLRHGHAEQESPFGDFHRALDDRGRREVSLAAETLRAMLPAPDVILASSAVRTRETAAIVHGIWAAARKPDPTLSLDRRLYHAEWSVLLDALQEIPASASHVLLVGHNPGISELAARWAEEFAQQPGFRGFDTAGWCSAVFSIDDWAALGAPQDFCCKPTPR